MKHLTSLVLFATAAVAQSGGQTWNSRLLPNVSGTLTPQTVAFAGRNWAVDDFSYSEYFLGAKSLGSAPCNVVNITATGDITAAVQAAINSVGTTGGGIVRIPADASKIDIGDWIVIQQFFWPALVNNNSAMPDQWVANSSGEFSFTYLRRVTSKSGNQVLLDAPIPWTLDPANNAVRVRATDGQMMENAGVKGITIRFANNTLASTGRPHGSGIYFEGVRDGWVYDVQVFNFPRNAIYLTYSARITILDCRAQTAQDTGGDGYGYGFLMSPAQNILIKGCHG